MAEHNPYESPQSDVEPQGFEEAYGKLRLFSSEGRLGRIRYLLFSTGLAIAGALLAVLLAVVVPVVGIYLALIVYIAMIVISVFFTIQRCHDFNVTGWLSLLLIVPLVPIIFYFIPGTKGKNKFGQKPPPNSTAVKVTAFVFLAILILAGITAVTMDPSGLPR